MVNAELWVRESNYTNKQSEMTRLNGRDLHSGKKHPHSIALATHGGAEG